MTREQHRARGLELLTMAENALEHQGYDRAAAYAAMATAHFSAACRYRAGVTEADTRASRAMSGDVTPGCHKP